MVPVIDSAYMLSREIEDLMDDLLDPDNTQEERVDLIGEIGALKQRYLAMTGREWSHY